MSFKKLLLSTALLLSPLAALAQTPQCKVLGKADASLHADKLAAKIQTMIFEMGNMPALLVGVVKGHHSALISCGEIRKNTNTRPTATTMWQIGSVSKVITTTILAIMVNEGKVKLSDPLSKFLPIGFHTPNYQQQKITLLDLATHTSGLPREAGAENSSLDDFQNNYAYKADEVYTWLNTYKLQHAPGTFYQYSNIGFGLLGNSLAKVERKTYAQLVNHYITKKLGMANTTLTPNAHQKQLEASSYWMNGDLIKNDWVFNYNRPSGGVYSNGSDLLKFLRYNLNLLNNKNIITNQIAHASYVYSDALKNKRTFSSSAMALGWEVDSNYNHLPLILAKNGWVSGFNTWVMIMPSRQIGLFSISNKPYLTIKGPLQSILRDLMQDDT